MNTENMERLYQEIANHVMQIIPEEWDKFLLYSEVDEERDATFFLLLS
ncbi:immunity protein YezG family protein [Listeria grandensis]|nr:immunity protein YezG family protein [Listeria grandensis]